MSQQGRGGATTSGLPSIAMSANALGAEARHPFLRAASGVFVASWLGFLAVGSVLPILPRYVHGPMGSGDVAVGVVIGAFAISAVITRPLAGRMADASGRRIVMLVGLGLMACGGALLFVRAGVGGLIVARLVLGAGEGLLYTAGTAWIVDLSPVERRGQSIGLFGLAVWGALSLGPLLGEALFELGGYQLVWTAAVVAPLAGVLFVVGRPEAERPMAAPGAARGGWLPREVVGPGVVIALGNVGYATMASFVGLLLVARGAGHGAVVFTAFAASIVLTRLALGTLPDRLGPRPTSIFALSAEAVGLACIAVAGSWPVAALGGVVMGMGFSLMTPSLALVVISRVPEERRGAALGAFTAFFDVGVGIGAPIAGALAALGGYGAAFWFAAALAAVGALVSARVATLPPDKGV